jgi:hypothetical protein
VHSLLAKLTAIAVLGFVTVHATSSAGAASSEVSSNRAWHLAAIYYSRYLGGCGGVGAVKKQGSYWIAPVHFGYAGTFRGYIRVDRQTGLVLYSSHPTVSAQSLDSWFASVTTRPRAP